MIDFIFMVIKEAKRLLCDCKVIIDIVFIASILFLLAIQFSHMASALYYNQDNRGVIQATDLDAGYGIAMAKDGNWFSGEVSYVYGPLYYRIAHTLEKFAPNFDKTNETEDEQTEKRIHFSLLLISLLSMYGMSFLFAHSLIAEIKFKLLAALLINTTFLNQYEWVIYIFRVHPDLLLSFLSALFLFFLYKSKNSRNYHFLCLSAFIGAAALSTRESFIIFIPFLVFIEIPILRKEKFLRLFYLFSLIIVFYFIIGFPKNFELSHNLSRLISQSQYSLAPTLESFVGWWSQLLSHGWQQLLVLLILFIVFGDRKHVNECSENKYLSLRLWSFAIIPFCILLSKNFTYDAGRYTFPFIAIMLMVTSISFTMVKWNWMLWIKDWLNGKITKYTLAVILLISVGMTIGIVPHTIEKVLNSVMNCREEARATYSVVKLHLDNGEKVLVDAYVPYVHNHENVVGGRLLQMTLNQFKEYDPDIFVINQTHLARIMEGERPNDYMLVDHKNWREIRKFYKYFYKKSEAVVPLGQKWIKTYEDNCGVEIWEKQ